MLDCGFAEDLISECRFYFLFFSISLFSHSRSLMSVCKMPTLHCAVYQNGQSGGRQWIFFSDNDYYYRPLFHPVGLSLISPYAFCFISHFMIYFIVSVTISGNLCIVCTISNPLNIKSRLITSLCSHLWNFFYCSYIHLLVYQYFTVLVFFLFFSPHD